MSLGAAKEKVRREVEQLRGESVDCGYDERLVMSFRGRVGSIGESDLLSLFGCWVVWRAALTEEDRYGFDLKDRNVTLFDEGMEKISTTT